MDNNGKVIARATKNDFMFICPEFYTALTAVAKANKISTQPALKGEFSTVKLKVKLPFWYLLHQVCICGANITTVHPDTQGDSIGSAVGAYYEIQLNPKDTIEKFCKRLVDFEGFKSRAIESFTTEINCATA